MYVKKSICAYFNVINSFEFFVRQSPEVTKYAKKLETQISAISTMRMKFQPLMISSSKAYVLPLYRCTAKYRQSTCYYIIDMVDILVSRY